MAVFADRVKETSTTTGTGTYNLAGAVDGHQTFVAGVGDGNTCFFAVEDGTDWEICIGTVTDATPDTLSRDTVIASSNAGSAVNWGAGSKTLFSGPVAELLDRVFNGQHTIWLPAASWTPATTSGPAWAQIEESTNAQNYVALDFGASADEYAHTNIRFPKGWNEGTLTFQGIWTTVATGTTGIAMGLQAVARSDGDAIDASWGTAVVVTDDAQSAANKLLVTAPSSAMTIAGTPAEGDLCFFRLFRDVSDANDDMTEDMRFLGLALIYTIDNPTDE